MIQLVTPLQASAQEEVPRPDTFINPLTDCNDYANGERIAAAVNGWARFVSGLGWRRWNGYRYEPAGDWMILQAATEARLLFDRASRERDEKTRMAIIKHANQSLKADRIAAAVHLASTIDGMKLEASDCDAQPHLLGVTNGIVDLDLGAMAAEFERTAGTVPFAGDFVTLQADCAYIPEAECPQWLRFLDTIFRSDPELILYIQTAIGYALSSFTSEHALFFFYGSGANGKSVFINVLKRLLGEYAAVISSDTLLARQRGQQTNDLARLPGRRLVVASELEDGARWNESLVKSLTGGDPISARFLYAEFFEFVPVFKLFVVGNHRPVVRGTDEGIWRRLQLIPFDVFIPADKRDPGLTDKLIAELPGILNWAMSGYRRWREHGLRPPSRVLDATAAYRTDEDRIGAFLDECCELDEQLSVQASALYKAYHSWAQRRGETPLSMTRFGTRLGERGIGKVKRGSIYYEGIWLLQENDVQQPSNPPD